MPRFRADLVELAWEIETAFGTAPATIDKPFGLIAGGVTLPDPRYEWEPFYGVGVIDRNLLFPIQGREVFEGSLPTVYLTHDNSRLVMEQIFGLIFNDNNVDDETSPGGGATTTTATTLKDTAQTFTSYKTDPPTHIVIVADKAATAEDFFVDAWGYIGLAGAADTVNVFSDRDLNNAGWNGKAPPLVGALQYSVHSITRVPINGAVGVLAPSVVSSAGIVDVRETLIQPSFSIAARFRADDAASIDVNYVGCKVSRATFNFEEGRPVTYSLDFIAQDLIHNLGLSTTVLKFGSPVAPIFPRPVEQPYFFSRASLTFGGTTFARFRRLSLSIDNQLDPRYYVTQGSNTDNRQILFEILEGRRQITLTGTVDMDDTLADAQFLRYLLNQGFTDADVRDMTTLRGVALVIELRRASDISGSLFDTMTFTIPARSEGVGTTDVGLILRSARHPIPGPPAVHHEVALDGFASSVRLQIHDSRA